MKKDDVVKEVLSAMKAQEILDSIRVFLNKSGETVKKQDIMELIEKGAEADGYYT